MPNITVKQASAAARACVEQAGWVDVKVYRTYRIRMGGRVAYVEGQVNGRQAKVKLAIDAEGIVYDEGDV